MREVPVGRWIIPLKTEARGTWRVASVSGSSAKMFGATAPLVKGFTNSEYSAILETLQLAGLALPSVMPQTQTICGIPAQGCSSTRFSQRHASATFVLFHQTTQFCRAPIPERIVLARSVHVPARESMIDHAAQGVCSNDE